MLSMNCPSTTYNGLLSLTVPKPLTRITASDPGWPELAATNVFAQQTKSISGVVYDSNTGEALIGVSVLEVGTTNGTITDFDGRYTLKVSSNKVSFSYVGFKTEIVNVTNSGTYNVNLVSDNKLDSGC